MSERQISDELSISLGEINYCLKALLEFGGVKMDNSAKSDQKRSCLYIVRSWGLSVKTGRATRFLAKKREEFEALLQERGRREFEIAADCKKRQLCLG